MSSDFTKYRKDIDGLRAIAIIAVVLFHLKPSLLLGGFVGVDIFFVISGFLITQILLREMQEKRFSFVGFYIRRVRRIFPALFVVMFCSLLVAVFILGGDELFWFAKVFRYSSIQISNFLFQENVGYFDPKFENTPLLHTWSLAVEEQFYLLLPLILFFSFKLKKTRNFIFYLVAILSLFSLTLSQYLLFNFPKISFFSLPSRFWELGLGALLAFHKIPQQKKQINEAIGILGLLLIIFALFFTDSKNFPACGALLPCFGAALVIFSGHQIGTFTAKLLASRIFVFFGLISYSLYLWHYPIIAFYKEFFEMSELSWLAIFVILVICITVSFLSYKYIENPFRKTRRLEKEKYFKIRNCKFYKPFLVSIFCILFFFSSALLVKIWQKQKQVELFGDTGKEVKLLSFNSDCLLSENKKFPANLEKECTKNGEEMEFLLLGDSHAVRYGHGLVKWAQKNNKSVAMIASTECPASIENGTAFCDKLQMEIDAVIKNSRSLKYVIFANKWNDDFKNEDMAKNSEMGLERNIKKYNDWKKKVIILGMVPDFSFDPAKCVAKNHALIFSHMKFLEKKDCYKEEKSTLFKNNLAENFFTKMVMEYDVKYFDPKPYFCDKKYCYSAINNQILYTDNNHLGLYGSDYVRKYFNF